MAFKAAVCPRCFGDLRVPDDRDVVKCMYCGVDVIVREAIKIKVQSADVDNLMNLALKAAEVKNHEEAYKYFTQVLEHDPANAQAWHGKGKAAAWLSRVDSLRLQEMIGAFNEALRVTPDDQHMAIRELYASDAGAATDACYQMVIEYFAGGHWVGDTFIHSGFAKKGRDWPHHIERCAKIVEAYEYCHALIPSEIRYMKSIVSVCKRNLGGYLYRNGDSMDSHKVDGFARKEMQAKVDHFVELVRRVEPDYEQPPKGCFVVTATMGNEFHPAVTTLRSFRDERLSRSSAGRRFIGWYQEHGPALAEIIRRSNLLRLLSLILIVAPATAFVRAFERVNHQR